MDHEGHSGWSAETRPDFVLLHLGHNDLCQGQNAAGTVEELGAIINTLREANTHVGILLAQVIASTAPCLSEIPALDAQLPALAEATTLPSSPVLIVDQHSNFDPTTMTYDQVHPNAAGESQTADR